MWPADVITFDAFVVGPDVLERYVGIYSIMGTPAKMTVTRDGATLYIKAGNEQASGIPLEATAENEFTIGPGSAIEFEVEQGLLIITLGGAETVFPKEE